jgi:RNA polymerase sigma factor (TIGR02999 family)
LLTNPHTRRILAAPIPPVGNLQESSQSITDLLAALKAGHTGAMDQLIPLVYDRLRTIAAAHLDKNSGTPTLQPTALVHELYFTLVDQHNATWQDRAHFFATASILMRRLIVDHARRSGAQKRGGGKIVSLESSMDAAVDQPAEIVSLHEALERLESLDPRQARIVELRYFGGLSIEETAEVLGISAATVKREWAMARAWLHSELSS